MSMAWSFSRLVDFELCKKRFHAKYILKTVPFVKNAAMRRGDEIHDDCEEAIKRVQDPRRPGFWEPLPEVKSAMPLIRGFHEIHDMVHGEQELAFNEQCKPVSWFDEDVWFRAKLDMVGVRAPQVSNIDWKTGKVREKADQLLLYNVASLLKWPMCHHASAAFIWLDHPGSKPVEVTLKREDLEYTLNSYGERAEAINMAIRAGNWPAEKCFQCRWCKIECEFNTQG